MTSPLFGEGKKVIEKRLYMCGRVCVCVLVNTTSFTNILRF